MFLSKPLCILKAGPTVDGREIPQQWIDEIAETYDPKKYNARINQDHISWWTKYGSVQSVEKRNDELWAILRPNSQLLSIIERGQLLHTSCEIEPNFAKTGKAYLTGLALTDNPASLGTSQISLSAGEGNKQYFQGEVLRELNLGANDAEQDEKTILQKLSELLQNKFNIKPNQDDPMNEELKALLEAQKNQSAQMTALTTAVNSLVELSKKEPETEPEETENTELAELKQKLSDLEAKHTELQNKHDELLEKLSNEPEGNNPERNPAGSTGAESDDYL